MKNTTYNKILYTDPKISDPVVNMAMVHPLVIFKVADHYQRRGKDADYVVGLLLGEIQNHDAIIRDVVPLHNGAERDTELVSAAYTAHHVLYPNEKILGWYSFSKHYVEFPSIIAEGSNGIHMWLRPYVPPKMDFFAIFKSKELHLISLPIQYSVQADVAEQLTLSRFADSTSHGSLQAAVSELISLLDSMQSVCKKQSKTRRDKVIGRQIHEAISQVDLQDTSRKALEDSLRSINTFSRNLRETDQQVSVVEDRLSVEYE